MIRVDTSAWFRGIVRVYDEHTGKMIAECECSTTDEGVSGLYVAFQAVYLQGKIDGSDAALRQLRRSIDNAATDGGSPFECARKLEHTSGASQDAACNSASPRTVAASCTAPAQGGADAAGAGGPGLAQGEHGEKIPASSPENKSVACSPASAQAAARHPAGAPRSYEGAGHLNTVSRESGAQSAPNCNCMSLPAPPAVGAQSTAQALNPITTQGV